MAKTPKRKQAKKRRRPGGHPARAGRTSAEREIESLVEQIRMRAIEAQAPDTPVQRVAAIIVEDFEEMPPPVGLVALLTERGSTERTRAIVAAVSERAPGSVTALTFAAEAARELDGDRDGAAALLDEALEHPDADCDPQLAEHLLADGDALAALDCLHDAFAEDPTDEHLLEIQAEALEKVHRTALTRTRPQRAERDVLVQFAERSLLYRLRDAPARARRHRPRAATTRRPDDSRLAGERRASRRRADRGARAR